MEKYSLKLEDEHGAITYKLGMLSSEQLNDLQGMIATPQMRDAIVAGFMQVRAGSDFLKNALSEEDEDEIALV